MSALTEDQRDMLRLYMRSPRDPEGWANVSKGVWPLQECLPERLVERERRENGSGRIRLTAEGQTVVEFLL